MIKKMCFLAMFTVLMILALAAIWEFWLENIITQIFGIKFSIDTLEERIEYLIELMCVVILAMIIPFRLVVRAEKKRRLVERELITRVEFEDLITSLSTHFINLSIDDIDDEINHALAKIGSFANVDRSYIFLISDDEIHINNTHEWCSKGIESKIHSLQELKLSQFHLFEKKLRKVEIVHIPCVADLITEEQIDRVFFPQQDVKSFILVPLSWGVSLKGFVGFSTIVNEKTWSEAEISLLKIVGDMFTNAIEHKQAEEKQRELIIALEKINDELKSFAHIVSHEIKRPLATVRTQIELLSNECSYKMSPVNKTQFDFVSEKLSQLNQLINSILQYSSLGWVEEEMGLIDLNDIITEVIENIGPPKNISIKIQNKLPSIWFEKVRILEVFQNLLENAVKYIHKPIGKIDIGCNEEGDYWKFWIKDNGRGIKSNEFDEIFTIFMKSEKSSKSTGIGLAIVKKIIEMYEGEVWVESELSEGSTFYFTLPNDDL